MESLKNVIFKETNLLSEILTKNHINFTIINSVKIKILDKYDCEHNPIL